MSLMFRDRLDGYVQLGSNKQEFESNITEDLIQTNINICKQESKINH